MDTRVCCCCMDGFVLCFLEFIVVVYVVFAYACSVLTVCLKFGLLTFLRTGTTWWCCVCFVPCRSISFPLLGISVLHIKLLVMAKVQCDFLGIILMYHQGITHFASRRFWLHLRNNGSLWWPEKGCLKIGVVWCCLVIFNKRYVNKWRWNGESLKSFGFCVFESLDASPLKAWKTLSNCASNTFMSHGQPSHRGVETFYASPVRDCT